MLNTHTIMKKITFLAFMFLGAIVLQAQENLLSNGDLMKFQEIHLM